VKILKGFPWKWFCKYACHLFFCAHIFNPDVLLCNLFPYKLILDWNVLVLECITGFFEILMVLVLLQYIGMGSSYLACISVRVCFIERTCVQHVVAAIYSTLVVDKDTNDCFLLIHDTKHSPK
jgi:hypothetical protein